MCMLLLHIIIIIIIIINYNIIEHFVYFIYFMNINLQFIVINQH